MSAMEDFYRASAQNAKMQAGIARYQRVLDALRTGGLSCLPAPGARLKLPGLWPRPVITFRGEAAGGGNPG